MSRAQAESVIKNIIREIAQECTNRGQVVSETLVAFIVKAVVLDPDNGFNVDRTLTKDDVQQLIKICIDKLLAGDSPELNTIKMQVYFDMNYTSRSDFLMEHRKVLESRLHLVVREITDSRARSREELENLYKKIVSCILLRSGLGSPTDISVVREVTAALQSVFPVTEIGSFMSLPKKDKERQLYELSLITTGIRLFNKECGKGGEGIDNLPAILSEAVPATVQNIKTEMEGVSNLAFLYAALLENSHNLKNAPEDLDWKALRDTQVHIRQQESLINILLHDISNCRNQIESLNHQFLSRMEILKDTVSSKTAVPTAQVYPQFINIANVWTGFQDEMVLVSVLSNIFSGLAQFSEFHKELFSMDFLESLAEGLEIKSDEERMTENSGEGKMLRQSRIANKKIEVLFPDNTKNFDQLPLQYRGFCGYMAVTYDRLLVPGNPDIGILSYDDNYYCFSSPEAAYQFADNPDYYITCIGDKAKKSPELIQLLELHRQFAAITPYSHGAGKMIETPIRKASIGTQTDTHFIESNIVKTYEWNEWELRRKAIKLTNLRTKITHSVQTNLSNYRRENSSQVYLLKESGTQSKRDAATKVPKPSTFIAGLRGGNCTRTKMTKVDLTLGIEET